MPDAKRRVCARRPTRIVVVPVVVLLVVLAGLSPTRKVLAGLAPPLLKGKVAGWERLFPQVYADASRGDAHRYTWREPSPTVKQEFRKLTANVSRDVCVAALGAGSAPPHEPYAVKVTGGRVTPSTIVVSPGSRLSFKNVDPFAHQLYEVNNASWAVNSTAPGSTREWAASAAGAHVIRDQLFPDIVMHIVVDPQAVEFAFPDKEGAFALPVPAGEYTLKVFFDGKPVSKAIEGVRVGERGLELRETVSLGGDSK
jgi:hypothetical protein